MATVTGWRQAEAWQVTLTFTASWCLAEGWQAAILTAAEWGSLEGWAGGVGTYAAWRPVEGWTGGAGTEASWNLLETWEGGASAPAVWRPLEGWELPVTAGAGWWEAEGWTWCCLTPGGWWELEGWTGGMIGPPSWLPLEGWGGAAEGAAGWLAAEGWIGGIRTLGPPVLLSPENDAWLNDNTPTLRWAEVPGALEYWVQVDNDPDLGTPLENALVAENEFTTSELENGTYYWRVRARAGELLSPWSEIRQFTVGYDVTPPTEPVPVSPENGTLLVQPDGRPTFSWLTPLDLESDRVTCRLEVSRDPGFSSPVYVREGITENEHTAENVLPQDSYWWRVVARDWAGNENVSRSFRLTLLVPPVSQVSPISPYWRRTSPVTVQASASDADGTVENVELWYRYSSDNQSWGPWILYDFLTSPPYTFYFEPPSGSGHYALCSRAWDNSGNHEDLPPEPDAYLGYDPVPPPAPTLLQPENGTTVSRVGLTFRWTSVSDLSGVTYELVVDNEPTFSSPHSYLRSGMVENEHACEDLLPAGTYYWRVRAVDGAGNENCSGTFTVTLTEAWISLESWQAVSPSSPAVWREVDSWTGEAGTTFGWRVLEGWTAGVAASAAWHELEGLGLGIRTEASWHRAEGWATLLPTSAGWAGLESWTVATAPPRWLALEGWSVQVRAKAGWLVAEGWTGGAWTGAPP
ncbi:MAG: hypothetical protein DSO04_02775, partial [Hadesarchaea archaeon]